MSMRLYHLFAVTLIVVAVSNLSGVAWSEEKLQVPTTFQLNLTAENCQISFKLGATAHTVHGDGALLPTSLQVDLGQKTIRGRIGLDLLKITTHNQGRDKNMHNDILESKKYPELYYDLSSFSGDLQPDTSNPIVVHGRMMIHGTEHPLDLPMTVTIHENNLTAQSDFIVPYVEWGMKDPSVFLLRVEKKVRAHIELKAELGKY